MTRTPRIYFSAAGDPVGIGGHGRAIRTILVDSPTCYTAWFNAQAITGPRLVGVSATVRGALASLAGTYRPPRPTTWAEELTPIVEAMLWDYFVAEQKKERRRRGRRRRVDRKPQRRAEPAFDGPSIAGVEIA